MTTPRRPKSEYWRAIELATKQGYRADLIEGAIYGRSGKRLKVKLYGKQRYPTVRLHVVGLPRPAYSVAAHKVMAYLIWGWAAFQRGVAVRHRDGDTENIRARNLRLGSYRENELDKPKWVRVASARAARAAQPHAPGNAILTAQTASKISRALEAAERSPTGRVRRGIVKDLAEQFAVSASTICLIGKGRIWNV